MGRVSGLMPRRRFRPAGEIVPWSMLDITADRSRTLPATSITPGFSKPSRPYRTSFMVFLSFLLNIHPAVYDKGLTGGEFGFVRSQINQEIRYLVSLSQAAHRLARNKILARLNRIGKRIDPALQRGGVDGAGTNGVAAYSLLDEILGHRLGEPDYRRLACPIHEPVRQPLYA